MTTLTTYDDSQAFAALAEPFLVRHEAENSLLLGIVASMRKDVGLVEPESAYLAIGRQRKATHGLVIWTKGWNAVLSFPGQVDFARSAGLAMKATGLPVPGVLGPRGAADAFAGAWSSAGARVVEGMQQLAYRLSTMPAAPDVPGHLRRAEEKDRDLLVEWMIGFARDADLRAISEAGATALVDSRLSGEGAIAYVWETDRPVSMASSTRPTPNGISVNAVYTPPELRGRGYASACVAALSRQLMEGGKRYCFLFTDVRNATSNSIYRRIGYRQVAEVSELLFEPAAG